MRLKIEQETFKEAIAFAKKAHDTKAKAPILANVLLATNDEDLRLEMTNLECTIAIDAPATILAPGRTTVPIHLLGQAIAKAPKGPLEVLLDEDGFSLVIKAKGWKAKFVTMPADEFPVTPTVDQVFSLPMPPATFAGILDRLVESSEGSGNSFGKESVLAGIYLEIKNGKMELAATDGFRLAHWKTDIEDVEDHIEVTVPAKSLAVLSKILSKIDGEDFTVGLSEGHFMVAVPGAVMTARRLSSRFPNFQDILPRAGEFKQEVEVARSDFRNALERAKACREKHEVLLITFGVDELHFGLESYSATYEETIPCKVTRGNLEGQQVAFDPEYLLDGVDTVEGEILTFRTSDLLRVSIMQAADPNILYLLMPTRLGDRPKGSRLQAPVKEPANV